MSDKKPTTLIHISTYIEKTQDAALDAISTERVSKSEHHRRALDIYLYLQRLENVALLIKIEKAAQEALRSSTNV